MAVEELVKCGSHFIFRRACTVAFPGALVEWARVGWGRRNAASLPVLSLAAVPSRAGLARTVAAFVSALTLRVETIPAKVTEPAWSSLALVLALALAVSIGA